MQPVINLTKYEYSSGPENPVQQQPSGVSKNVKALSPTGKRNDYKTYVLRDVKSERAYSRGCGYHQQLFQPTHDIEWSRISLHGFLVARSSSGLSTCSSLRLNELFFLFFFNFSPMRILSSDTCMHVVH